MTLQSKRPGTSDSNRTQVQDLSKSDSGDVPGGSKHKSEKAQPGQLSKPKLVPFSHGFWSPEVAMQRQIYMKGIAATVVLLIFVMWIAVPFFFGSLAHQRSYSDKLSSWFINKDYYSNGTKGEIGLFFQNAFEENIRSKTKAKLGWSIPIAGDRWEDQEIQRGVLEEKVWVAVVVQPLASQNLTLARLTGDSTYNSSAIITVYYTQARNELASANFIVPYTQSLLISTITRFGAVSVGEFLGNYGANGTMMGNVARAPQTLSASVGFTMVNLRPYSAPVASALTLVGSILVIVFAFTVTMAGYAARQAIEPYLKIKELLILRIAVPTLCYIPLSLAYSMVSLTFKVPFGAKYSYAGGYFCFWAITYLSMTALGLGTEAMVTLLTQRFITYFLVVYIISNVSTASLPIILEPWIYRYGYGFPIYNVGQATRTLIFNTKNHLGLNAAVLIGWILLSMCTTVLFQYLVRRVAMKDYLSLNTGRKVGEEEVGLEGGNTGPESLALSEDRKGQHPPRIEKTKEIMDREAKE
ncbi:uncharacterized protein EI90DRAFT_2936677 [Cantharellus anzutake]|uniref:uncharacterized protein n=1 Tax=Cantharellus anzutake TaxID=1750568 RepID=UPI001903D8F2|nr:uncharacterized protein EI90DRAFT_2936677 [Cantharellus anzutake]KAF8322825.1 hypothetical protein EI90DRAFT_2936677 [Cantharellus anzutake]